MNKFLALVNIDLRRSRKIYYSFLIFINSIILISSIISTISFKSNIYLVERAIARFGGVFYGIAILCNNNILLATILLGAIGILIYITYTLYSEYYGKNKSIYTLSMLPQNKYYIYLGKIASGLCMIYMYLVSVIITLIAGKYLFNFIMGDIAIYKTTIINDIYYSNSLSSIIPINFIDFLVEQVLNNIAVLSFILALMLGSVNKSAGFMVLIIYKYISNKIFDYSGYLNISFLYERYGEAGVNIVENLGLLLISLVTAYFILNKTEIYKKEEV